MSGQIDAFGGLATATLAAREFDRGSLHDPGAPGHCANCEAVVDGRFCANCGQPAHVHRSLLHVAEEFLHGLTHFDGKAWKTLPLLLFRPGKLTHDYVHGKRARYVPPVALFLLTVFLMFFAFSFASLDRFGKSVIPTPNTPAERAQAIKAADKAVVDITAELAKAEADPNAKPGQAGVLAGALAAAQVAQSNMHNADARAKGLPAGPDKSIIPDSQKIFDEIREANDRGEITTSVSNPTIKARLHHALQNPELALYKIQGKAYKFSFLMVPLSLPVLWLMFFWKRHIYLYDHAVFALYSLSFMSLLAVLLSALFGAGVRDGTVFGILIGIVPLAHMIAQLKGAYQLSVFGAAWRTGFLAISAVMTLAMFSALILLLGVVD
jgi:hypothetical protein